MGKRKPEQGLPYTQTETYQPEPIQTSNIKKEVNLNKKINAKPNPNPGTIKRAPLKP